MATYTNTKDVIGEQSTLDGLIERSLTEFTDADVLELGKYAFYSNNTIKSITLPNLTKIGHSSFINCSALSDIHIGLEKSTMCTLASTSALNNTGRSIIFVPPDLVNTYKSGTNWSTYAGRIYAEGDPDAPVWDESEITDTESQLFTRINNGTAASYYKLGQYKSVNFGTLGTLRMQIIGINADELSDGSGKAQLTWFPMEFPSATHRMNPTLSGTTEGTGAIGGWEHSEMRTYLNDTVWPLIPETWRNMIKEVKKYSLIYNTSGQVENDILTTDKIWLPSSREVNNTGSTSYTDYTETQGPVYAFAFTANNERIRKVGTSASYWWLRSAGFGSKYFAHVDNNGGWYYNGNGDNGLGVGFGFCT